MSRAFAGPLRRPALLVLPLMAALAGGCANSSDQGPESRLGSGHGANGARPGSQQDLQASVGDLVYFASDSSTLTPEAETTLTGQSRWLSQHQDKTITVEGHADERGTREYNIALGARRAQSVRNYLVSRGIDASRIRTISYGKERPVAVCDDISCWSQNRRAQTILSGVETSQR